MPIIQAFAEGKTIEFRNSDGEWEEADSPTWGKRFIYRIKPDPKYRSFKNQEECWKEMQKHNPFGWIKSKMGNIFNIIALYHDEIKLNECEYGYSELSENYMFMDGTPFGIKED